MNDELEDPEDRIGGIGDPATLVITYPCFTVIGDSDTLYTVHVAAGATGTPSLDARVRPNGANAVLVFTDEDLLRRFAHTHAVTSGKSFPDNTSLRRWLREMSGQVINGFRIDYVFIDPEERRPSMICPIDALETYLEHPPM